MSASTPIGAHLPTAQAMTDESGQRRHFRPRHGQGGGELPEAETLMGIAAFLAPDRIPLGLITADVIGEDELNKAVRALSQCLAD